MQTGRCPCGAVPNLGSTYLAIRFAIETLPRLRWQGPRFVVAGMMLYGWARLRGAASPAPRHWPSALLSGVLLLLGNGGDSLGRTIVFVGIGCALDRY
jgi:hypothetical protein